MVQWLAASYAIRRDTRAHWYITGLPGRRVLPIVIECVQILPFHIVGVSAQISIPHCGYLQIFHSTLWVCANLHSTVWVCANPSIPHCRCLQILYSILWMCVCHDTWQFPLVGTMLFIFCKVFVALRNSQSLPFVNS